MCANLLGWFQGVDVGWVGDTGHHERHGINRWSRGGHQGVLQAGLARRSYFKVRRNEDDQHAAKLLFGFKLRTTA
jgi:hypothetical protein